MELNQWQLDTCGCVVEHLLDAKLGAQFSRFIRKCEPHTGAAVTDLELYEAIVANENHRVAFARGELIENDALGLSEVAAVLVPGEAARFERRLKPGVLFQYRFDGRGATRSLVCCLSGAGVDAAARTAALAAVAAKVGAQRIQVVDEATFAGSPTRG